MNNEVKTEREIELEESITNAFAAAKRARYLIDEMTDEYFERNNEKNKDDQVFIIHFFDRYRAYSELISNSLWEVCNILSEARDGSV